MSVSDVGINGRGKMESERVNELFKFRDDLKRVLGQDWSETTKRELEDRLWDIERNLYLLDEQRKDRDIHNEGIRRMNKEHGDDIKAQYRNNEFYTGRF